MKLNAKDNFVLKFLSNNFIDGYGKNTEYEKVDSKEQKHP